MRYFSQIYHTSIFQGTTIKGPYEYTAVADMSSASSTFRLNHLVVGSSNHVIFSLSLYEGMKN